MNQDEIYQSTEQLLTKYYAGKYNLTDFSLTLIKTVVDEHLKTIDPNYDWGVRMTADVATNMITVHYNKHD